MLKVIDDRSELFDLIVRDFEQRLIDYEDSVVKEGKEVRFPFSSLSDGVSGEATVEEIILDPFIVKDLLEEID